ncbi:UNVERIFIED_CONTAM: hypothetical protein Sradi_0447600 [Sesamum radiatum]|uniref:Uncharacterized protein n=1 Tax=Sesamum radiatum TaxID=300843 RepID=A0AAW2W6C0_SESRA
MYVGGEVAVVAPPMNVNAAYWRQPEFLRPVGEAKAKASPRSEYKGYKMEEVGAVVMNEQEKQMRSEKKPFLFDLNLPAPLF